MSTDARPVPVEWSSFWLSYEMDEHTPAYGGGRGLELARTTAIAEGDTANTVLLSMPNHLGTHVDAPSHFFDGAPTLSDYPSEEWIFRHPVLVDTEVESGHLVEPDHLSSAISGDADIVLIRTGHGRLRGTPEFWEAGPGLSADLGRWLRRERPAVRAVGMDLISVTTRLNREAGRAAHRAFLDPNEPGKPIRLVEDMRLLDCPLELNQVVVSPLRLRGGDGAPVTVFGLG